MGKWSLFSLGPHCTWGDGDDMVKGYEGESMSCRWEGRCYQRGAFVPWEIWATKCIPGLTERGFDFKNPKHTGGGWLGACSPPMCGFFSCHPCLPVL